jgi:MYXO-CTERM domain-containing protein
VALASAELYNPAGNGGAGTFAATGAMTQVRINPVSSVLPSGKVLIAGGRNAQLNGVALASAEIYDPAGNVGAGTFTATATMTSLRSGGARATLLPSGKVLVAGGSDGTATLASAELYDPAGNAGAGAFVLTGSMTTTRQNPSASLLPSGLVLVAGGSDGGATLATAELYDPAGNGGAGSFTATGSMSAARWKHTASVFPAGNPMAGNVLVTGGADILNQSGLASAEIYNAGAFTLTGSMAGGRYSHTATVLPSGKVLVAGGANTPGPLPAAENAQFFDPTVVVGGVLGIFTGMGPLAAARYQHSASLLPSGKVLVAGGLDLASSPAASPLASAEVSVTALGEACAPDCISGLCADGLCCDSACTGACDRCDLAMTQGRCTLLAAGDVGANPVCAPHLACNGKTADCASCSSDAGCELGYYCALDATCQPHKAQGEACNTPPHCKQPGCQECASGFCVDGVCCDVPVCTGTCQACSAALKQSAAQSGSCGPSKVDTDPHAQCVPFLCASGACATTCTASSQCAAAAWCKAGACVPKISSGSACPSADACSSGFCVDGVCCDKACDGQCEACDSFAGTCGPISGAPHGSRPACGAGLVCSPATAKCTTPGAAATCDNDHTLTAADGTKQDCAPYKCDSIAGCRSTCSSVNDCTAPTLCDATGKCVPPPASTGGDGGCAVSVTRSGPDDGALRFGWLVTVAALALARRRRRRRS